MIENLYINAPFVYIGSKYKLLPQLIPIFDKSKRNFIDLFAGGGSIYANVVDIYDGIWVNDKVMDLIEIHQCLVNNGQSFIESVKANCWDKDDAEGYRILRDSYNGVPSPDKLYALILCCTNNMMRFNKSGKFNQTWGRRSFNNSTQKKIDRFLSHITKYKDKLHFTSLDFEHVAAKDLPRTMIYADCPYNSNGGNNHAGYNTSWNDSDDIRLFNYLIKAHGAGASFALSNVYSEDARLNAPLVNKLIETNLFEVIKLNGDYKKVARDKTKKQLTEIVIRNYK